MVDRVKIDVKGLAQLQNALLQLPNRVNNNVVRSAVNAGAAVIRTSARSLAPVYHGSVQEGHPAPGTLRKMIITKFVPELSSATRKVYFVAVRHGKRYQKVRARGGKTQNLDAFYWWWVEKGTSKMSARPYLRPAFYSQQGQAVIAIKNKLSDRIPLEVAKLNPGGR
jgi:HK97 gp10 family phage protein